MAFLGQAFNPADVEPAADFSPMPDGEYVAMITDSETKQTMKGDNYLSLTFQIIEGEYNNRLVWHSLHLWNPNETAQRIAQQQLSAICQAVDFSGILEDSETLHNLPMIIKVKYVPATGQYKEKNEIKAFKKAEGYSKPAAPQQQPLAASTSQPLAPKASAPAASGAPMWAK